MTVSRATSDRRLLKLAAFLDALPPERFDYRIWVGEDWKGAQDLSCGTTGCAMGWAATMPEFRRLGLRLEPGEGTPYKAGTPYIAGTGLEAFLAADAIEHGVSFYVRPSVLDHQQVDDLLREAVKRINSSGWVLTAESCQGHPDAEDAWANNTRPMLRLATARPSEMLRLLMKAIRLHNLDQGFRWWMTAEIFPSDRPVEPWEEVLVYLTATTTGSRNAGCRVFEHFGSLLTGMTFL